MKLSHLPLFDLSKQTVARGRKAPGAKKSKKTQPSVDAVIAEALTLIKEAKNGNL